jgi:cyclopropane-fatty-acyl-phospholipid synthase
MTEATAKRPDAAATIAWAARRAGVDLPVRVRAWDGSESGPDGDSGPGAALAARAAPHPVAAGRATGRVHSRSRDRAVIAGHYDLPPSFFRLFLDPSMAYACGYWTSDEAGYGLADAQRDQLDLACRKLGREPGRSLLDVGCGRGLPGLL